MGKSSSQPIGYWYHVAYHAGLGVGPIDALLEIRAGDKTAWSGELTRSGTITINQPNLFGGEKDQGGIVGDVDVMFGEPTQQPNPYLTATFGNQQPAWRGMSTLAFKGGKFGAMNPYPQKPSYKVRAIKMGWDGDPGDGSACWYPEKASVSVLGSVGSSTITDFAHGFSTNAPTMYQLIGSAIANTTINANGGEHWRMPLPVAGLTGVYCEFHLVTDGTGDPLTIAITDVNGTHLLDFCPLSEILTIPDPQKRPAVNYTRSPAPTPIYGAPLAIGVAYSFEASLNRAAKTFTYWLRQGPVVLATGTAALLDGEPAFLDFTRTSNAYTETAVSAYTFVRLTGIGTGMNPAHILYSARTASDMGRNPIATISDASFRAGADWFYNNGVGLCTDYNPSAESVDDFIARVEKVSGCSTSRSPIDGLWYLDIANGEYNLASLPILTDDDILDFQDQPKPIDSAINSLSVTYFDPEQKQSVTPGPVQAMALVDANGVIPDTVDYPEIPTGQLALRIVQRDLRGFVTPSHTFQLTTTRKPYGWRPNTYFRLQSAKRGIADMVCIIAEKSTGTLKSGAIKLTASQDVYSLPAASFVQGETGVDTRPPQIAVPIADQSAFEAPYFQLVRSLSRADLQALPSDVGYLMAVAKDPSNTRDYTITVSVDGGATYGVESDGPWCPTALVVEGDTLQGHAPTKSFTLSGGALLSQVQAGAAALWDGEMVRVDAIDAGAGTLTLGRGCVDTPPVPHLANSRIWFFDGFAGADTTEYTNGEAIKIKLLTNTGSQRLDPSAAAALDLTFAQRQNRPYPPAGLLIAGNPYPVEVLEPATLTWSHRDRVTQADQLIDTTQPDIGPEAGVTYTMRSYLEGALAETVTGIADTTATPNPGGYGSVRVEIDAVRDGVASFKPLSATFTLKPNLNITTPSPIVFTYGVVSTQQLQADGQHAPFVWSVDALPTGVSMDTSGLLSYDGVGATASVNPTFTVTDSVSNTRSKKIALQVAYRFLDFVDSLSPVAHWQLDETSGTTLTDRVGAEIATLSGAIGTSVVSSVPGLLAYDADTAINCSLSGQASTTSKAKWALGSGDFSMFLIAKWTASDFRTVTSVRGSGSDIMALFTINRTQAGGVGCESWNWASSSNYTFTQAKDKAYNDGKPHALGLTYEASTNTLRLYVDGVMKASRTQTGSYSRPASTTSTMKVWIGSNAGSQPFGSTLDEIVLFDHKLTDADMATLAGFVATN